MSLATPTPMPDPQTGNPADWPVDDGNGGTIATPDLNYPDAGLPWVEKWLLVRWQDNRSERWSKQKMISLGKQGETNLIRKLQPMGTYRSRQFEFVLTDAVAAVISSIEDVNGVLA